MPALDRVLDPRRRDRVIDDRIRADEEHDLGLQHVHHRVRHRAGADAFEQRGDARRVAEPRAVVDVVRAEAGAHQLLEQVRLLVAALRRAEAGERLRAVRVANPSQRAAGERERLVPARLAEHVEHALAGSIVKSGDFGTPARRISGRWSAAADGARSRSRSVPSRTAARDSPGRRGPRRGRSRCP